MGRKKKRRRISKAKGARNTETPAQAVNKPQVILNPKTWWALHPRWKLGFKWAGWVLTFLGAVATLLSLQSHVSVAVSSSRPPKPRDPLSRRFTVTNEGIVPLKDVWSKCTVDYMEYYHDGKYYAHATPGADLLSDSLPFRTLGVGDAVSVACIPFHQNTSHLSLLDSIDEVQITLRIFYRLWPLAAWHVLTRHKDARFGTRRYTDGSFQWEADPLPSMVRESWPEPVPTHP
jgi:hypothetical protein